MILKTTYADFSSTGTGRYGEAIKLLSIFTNVILKKNTKWAHIDIAGPA